MLHYAILIINLPQDDDIDISIGNYLVYSFELPLQNKKIENQLAERKSIGNYAASKNGKKYYLNGCSGVKRIKIENLIYFNTKQEAELAGYEPAENCKGI